MLRLLQFLIAIPILGVSLLVLFAGSVWAGDLILFFLPWIGFAALFVAGASWVFGAMIVAGSSLLLLIVIGGTMLGAWTPPNDLQRDGPTVSVMTFNTYIHNEQPAELEAYLQSAPADIVVMQEVIGTEKLGILRRLFDIYPFQADMPAGAEVALISRFPIRSVETLALDRGNGLDGSIFRVKIDIDGMPAVVYGVHAPTPRFGPSIWEKRNGILNDLAASVAAEEPSVPVIIAGDFNTPPWSPFFQDLLRDAGLADTSGRLFPLATRIVDRDALPKPFGSPVDHILVSDDIGWSPAVAGPPVGSDHRPVIAEIYLPR